jgi:hypothetical protein
LRFFGREFVPSTGDGGFARGEWGLVDGGNEDCGTSGDGGGEECGTSGEGKVGDSGANGDDIDLSENKSSFCVPDTTTLAAAITVINVVRPETACNTLRQCIS